MRNILPNLATQTPLWLALLTVGVNAIVGALRASSDDEHHWDIVGLSTFAVLMGLGGGFIRDVLLGNTPVESLRTPWYLVAVLTGIALVLVLGKKIAQAKQLVALLNSVALGLFAITGTAYALRANLPIVSSVFVGVVSAVGGGVLVSVIKDEVPEILLTSAPNALLALAVSVVYAGTNVVDAQAAGVAGITTAIVANYLAQRFGIRTRRATNPSAVLLTRKDSAEYLD
jgi:uncharacterized membrane protein YeiH